MKLINGYDLMDYAKKHGYILPAFNTTNLEMTYAIAKGLDDAKLPGYIQISSNNLRLSNPRNMTHRLVYTLITVKATKMSRPA